MRPDVSRSAPAPTIGRSCRPLCSHTLRFDKAWYATRNTAAPTTATTTLYTFNPVTPGMPNAWNSQPPTTAPTMPNRISNNIPSPDLLTSLLAMNPEMSPSTIQTISDISFSGTCDV